MSYFAIITSVRFFILFKEVFAVNKKKWLALSISTMVLVVAAFFTWQFAIRPTTTTTEQSSQSSATVKAVSAEAVYEELIGNLGSVINETEKKQVFTLIEKLLDVEKSGNDDTERNAIYKDIIKILDEVTLRGHAQEELNTYKMYFNAALSTQGTSLETKDGPVSQKYQYSIEDDGNILPKSETAKSATKDEFSHHKETWENAQKITPFELLKDLDYYEPFYSNITEVSAVGGYIEPNFNVTPYEWSIGLSVNAVNALNLPYVLIHEYGHYLSLKDATIKTANNGIEKEVSGGKLLQDFIVDGIRYIAGEFENIDKDKHYLFYARHKDDYVSKYAATNVLDDFAESFAHFVAGASFNSEVLNRKMNFFNSRSELVEIKNKILDNMKANNMGDIVIATK